MPLPKVVYDIEDLILRCILKEKLKGVRLDIRDSKGIGVILHSELAPFRSLHL